MMRFLMSVLLAVMATGCAGKQIVETKIDVSAEVETLDFTEGDWIIFYHWLMSHEDDSEYLVWHPATEDFGNEALFNTIPTAAHLNGFPVEHFEKFLKEDADTEKYILIIFSKEKLDQSIVTFVVKNGDRARKFESAKSVDQDWFEFYSDTFKHLRKQTPRKVERLDGEGQHVSDGHGEGVGAEVEASGLTEVGGDAKVDTNVEQEPATQVTKKGCKPGDLACMASETVETSVSKPDAVLDRDKFLELLNAYREEKSLEPVSYDGRLDKAAEEWSEYHKEKRLSTLKHEHGGSAPHKRVTEAGYAFSTVAENLARVESIDPNFLLVGWKHSLEHNENMLRDDVQHIGISCTYAPLEDETIAPFVCVQKLASEKGAKVKKKKKKKVKKVKKGKKKKKK